MNKRRLLKIGICILVLFVIILIIFVKQKNNNYGTTPENIIMDQYSYIPTYEVSKVNNVATFMTVNNCVDIYVNYISEKNNQALYSTSIEDYIKRNNINENNILTNFANIEGQCNYFPDIIYECDNNFYFKSYFVFGKIVNVENNTQIPYNFLINIDSKDRTFEIAPLEKVYNEYITILGNKKVKIDEEKLKNIVNDIKRNDFNIADIEVGIGDKEVMQYYFKQYLSDLMFNKEKAYDLLDNKYKEGRFKEYNEFERYVKDNEEYIKKSFLKKYKIEEFSDYKEYLCIDNYNNYYIFKETEPMEYTVSLDQYTIEDKIFVEQYQKKEEEERVQKNLEKFFQMLNRQDYTSAYEVLNEDFRVKYFDTEEKFVEYISKNFYKYNNFKFIEISRQNGKYKVKTQINNCIDNVEETVKRFSVEIDGGKFKISFNI